MIGMAIQASYRRTAPLSPRCLRITATAPLLGGSGTIRLLSKLPPLVRSTIGPPVTVFSISTAFSAAKHRNGSRNSFAIRLTSNTPTLQAATITII